jgi:hypothetical protein
MGLNNVDEPERLALLGAIFRGVALSRLGTVLRQGIDVTPSHAPFYAEDFEKAWEYGGWPKMILALNPGQLDRTFREVASDAPLAELNRCCPACSCH